LILGFEFFLEFFSLSFSDGVLLLDFLGVNLLTRLVLDLTSTFSAGSLLALHVLFEEGEGVHDLVSIHSFDRVLRLELGELLTSEFLSVSIRELDDLQELSSDEAA